MKRLLLASFAAGIGMFTWSALAHMILPLGDSGLKEIPNEEPLTAAMSGALGGSSGMYVFPDPGTGTNSEKMARFASKMAKSPSGVLIYHPPGAQDHTGRQLTTEFLTEWLESLLALALLAQAEIARYGPRVGFVVAIGLVAAVATNLPYWNWYGFPGTYTVAYMFTQLTGFIVAGLIGAAVLGRRARANAYGAVV
jgi:hypothetical protein